MKKEEEKLQFWSHSFKQTGWKMQLWSTIQMGAWRKNGRKRDDRFRGGKTVQFNSKSD